MWVCSHTEIHGNKIAVDLAKNAHDSNHEVILVDLELLLFEIKSTITKHCMEIWQRNYDSSNGIQTFHHLTFIHLTINMNIQSLDFSSHGHFSTEHPTMQMFNRDGTYIYNSIYI